MLIAAFSITMPHLQARRDELQCDTLCQGSMTSVRSALTLIGSALMGRLSDTKTSASATATNKKGMFGGNGRTLCLYIGTFASLIGLIINASMHSIQGMWLGMIPSALLQQNFSVYKAMLADYHEDIARLEQNQQKQQTDSTTKEEIKSSKDSKAEVAARASSVGQLGMSVGIAFMVGPLCGAMLVKTYQNAVVIASCLTLLSIIWIVKMPISSSSTSSQNVTDIASNKKDDDKEDNVNYKSSNILSSWKQNITKLISVKSAKSKPALFLMFIRLSMALAFHIFSTIWTVSLKRRFNFGPSDHGKFMSFIGLVYALSQGFVAKRILAPFSGSGKGRINVILSCCVILGVGRVVAFTITDIRIVYVTFGFIVTALGVVNTVLTADTCLIAPSSEIGAVYGVLEAAQSAAGMVGPFIGGLLARVDPVVAPLSAVVGLYVVVFLFVLVGYEKLILKSKKQDGSRGNGEGDAVDTILKTKKEL